MATTKDCLELALEESPRYEGAPATTPFRVSTVKRYFPIQTASIRPNPQLLDRSDEVRGIEGAVPQLIDGYEPDGALSMRCYLNDLPFLLEIGGFVDTITVGNGIITDPDGVVIPTGAFKHTFAKRTGLTAKTAQLHACYADELVFLRGQGFACSGITLDAAGNIAADLAGMVLQNIVDPNLTPTWDASTIYPIRRGDIFLTWLGGSGTPDDFSIGISNPLVRRRTMALTTPSFFPDKMELGDERVRLTGSIPMSTLTDGDTDALLAASTFTAKARWRTTVNIAGSYKYSVFVEMPKCQYVGGAADDLANRRRFGGSYDWFAAWDESAGYDARITVVNSIATIETLV